MSEYLIQLKLNRRKITKVNITDYYLKKHPDITEELIMSLVKMLTDERLKGGKRWGKRIYYVWDNIPYQDKLYRLIWWIVDSEPTTLYIRNCHRRD